MTHRQIKHEQFFPISIKDDENDAIIKANTFLKESSKEHPEWFYFVKFQPNGILVTGETSTLVGTDCTEVIIE